MAVSNSLLCYDHHDDPDDSGAARWDGGELVDNKIHNRMSHVMIACEMSKYDNYVSIDMHRCCSLNSGC